MGYFSIACNGTGNENKTRVKTGSASPGRSARQRSAALLYTFCALTPVLANPTTSVRYLSARSPARSTLPPLLVSPAGCPTSPRLDSVILRSDQDRRIDRAWSCAGVRVAVSECACRCVAHGESRRFLARLARVRDSDAGERLDACSLSLHSQLTAIAHPGFETTCYDSRRMEQTPRRRQRIERVSRTRFTALPLAHPSSLAPAAAARALALPAPQRQAHLE